MFTLYGKYGIYADLLTATVATYRVCGFEPIGPPEALISVWIAPASPNTRKPFPDCLSLQRMPATVRLEQAIPRWDDSR